MTARPDLPVRLVVAGGIALAALAACGAADPSPSPDVPTGQVQPNETVNEETTEAAASSADPLVAALDNLVDLDDTDPSFSSISACAPVTTLYRWHRTAASMAADDLSRYDVESELWRAVADDPYFADASNVQDAAVVAETMRSRANEAGGSTSARRLVEEPIAVGGRSISVDADDVLVLFSQALRETVQRCSAPPGDDLRPVHDADLDLPAHVLMAFHRRDQVWITFELGANRLGLATQGDLWSLDVAPDGAAFVVETTSGLLELIDLASGDRSPLTDPGDSWTCPSWTTDGTAVLAAMRIGEAAEYVPMRVALDGDSPPEPLPPGANVCPKSIGPGDIAYVEADGSTVVAMDSAGHTRDLFALPGCGVRVDQRARDGVLDVYAACTNPYLDGLYLVNVETGSYTHHIAGLVGVGHVSADGRWRVFGYVPDDLESPRTPELWVRDEQSGRTARLPVSGLTYPAFVGPPPSE